MSCSIQSDKIPQISGITEMQDVHTIWLPYLKLGLRVPRECFNTFIVPKSSPTGAPGGSSFNWRISRHVILMELAWTNRAIRKIFDIIFRFDSLTLQDHPDYSHSCSHECGPGPGTWR
jgi:hypothetical protein